MEGGIKDCVSFAFERGSSLLDSLSITGTVH